MEEEEEEDDLPQEGFLLLPRLVVSFCRFFSKIWLII